MINAMHAIIHSTDADATRAFFKDVLELDSVDAGGGWLIFAMPPAELGIHPDDAPGHPQLYFMCDDIAKTMTELSERGVEFTAPVMELDWGKLTSFQIPGGGELGLYEPKHPLAAKL